jgi:hypothetical protein
MGNPSKRALSGKNYENRLSLEHGYKLRSSKLGFFDAKAEGCKNIPSIFKKYENNLNNLKVTKKIVLKYDFEDENGNFIEAKYYPDVRKVVRGILLADPHSKVANRSTELNLQQLWGSDGTTRWNAIQHELYHLMESDYWIDIKMGIQNNLCYMQIPNFFIPPDHQELYWELVKYGYWYRIKLMVRIKDSCHKYYI